MNICVLILASIGFLPVSGTGADTARVAVASTGRTADAKISSQASRAPYILVFDREARLVEVIENRDVAARRAGPQLALKLKGKKVSHYIAEKFGPNLVRALDSEEIEHVEKTGPADEAVRQLLKEIPTEGAPRLSAGNRLHQPGHDLVP